MKLHVLNHHFWPDGSPSAILEEELADRLLDMGFDTVLVAGSGKFHDSERPAPESPIVRLQSGETGNRRSQVSVLLDYIRFWRAARKYIHSQVSRGDAFLATTSPFMNVFLIGALRRREAITIMHLHDYLPSNIRSISPFHAVVAPIAKWLTDRALRRWGLVVRCAGNLAYHASNSVVARFWPTIDKPTDRQINHDAKKALYAGNLGIAHDVPALIAKLNQLHHDGYDIDFYGDGPKMSLLPNFVHRHNFASGDEFLDVLYSHPIHVVVGTLGDGTGAFPSKAINSLYIGADVVPIGYPPALMKEFDEFRAVPDLMSNLDTAAGVVADYITVHETRPQDQPS